jgi:predicted alpha/beta-fold hydrolase
VLEQGPFIYHRYFISKWKQSLLLKQRLFPQRYDFAPILTQHSIKEMTRIMVEQYSEFPTLDAYLSGYAIVGDRLAQLAVPSHILLSLDDPIIPARDLQDVARSAQLQIAAIPHGGHCGFMESFVSESWADRQVAQYMGLRTL